MAGELNGRELGMPAGARAHGRRYRVAFAQGTRSNATDAATIELDAAGRPVIDGTAQPAALADHHVLVTSLPDPTRAAQGVRRVEVVVDGWRFELDVDSEARARLRERATSARA